MGGFLLIKKSGLYEFATNSDDGSRMIMEGSVVVDNDGLHGMRMRSGQVQLESGEHEIILEFFEKGGNAGMQFYYNGPDTESERVIVPSTVLSHITRSMS